MKDNAKRIELDAAAAMQEALVSGDMENYRLATERHKDALARLPGVAERHDEWIRRLAQRRLAEIHAEQRQSA